MTEEDTFNKLKRCDYPTLLERLFLAYDEWFHIARHNGLSWSNIRADTISKSGWTEQEYMEARHDHLRG